MSMNTIKTPVLVIGAGPAGLATAVSLKQRGISATLVEQSSHVAPAWHTHYDRLHLHTDKRNSGLPGFPWPRSAPRYPSKAQVIAYMSDYARAFDLQIDFNQRVTAAQPSKSGAGWVVQCENQTYNSAALVVAAGYNRQPHMPTWPGQDTFQGTVTHSATYRNGQPYRGQRALVVGFGNSGGEIAMDLHEHGAQVALAIRSPVNVIPKEVLGIPYLSISILQQWLPARWADALNGPTSRWLMGDLKALGLQPPAQGPMTQIREQARVPFIDTGTIGLIRAGQVAVRPGIARLTPNHVVFTNGQQERFDALVLATGYRTGLGDWLHASTAVSPAGKPACSGAPIATEPGLYFCGYHVAATGMLREINREAQRVAACIQRSGLV